MTDAEMLALAQEAEPARVRVTGTAYTYDGWLVAVFSKLRSGMRCVVEDEHGRLFIHNAAQLEPKG